MSSAEAYDPAANSWSAIAPMRNRRSGIGIIAHHGHIFAIGKPLVSHFTNNGGADQKL